MAFMEVKKQIGAKELVIQTGKMAKQANGSVTVSYGGNTVLVTSCAASEAAEGQDFFPLTVVYQEKYYAAGKIPGGYFKREAKPSNDATLIARLIDRPIRPLFPKEFMNETQVVVTTFSADQIHSIDAIGVVGASASLAISDIPQLETAGGVRLVYVGGEYVPFPTLQQIEDSELDIMVAGTRSGIIMVEGGAKEVSEEILLKALEAAQEFILAEIELIEELASQINPVKMEVPEVVSAFSDEEKKAIYDYAYPLIDKENYNADKHGRSKALKALKKEILAHFEIDSDHEGLGEAKAYLDELESEAIRRGITEKNTRPDGRKSDEIRDITVEVDLYPNLHGSALFTRGQTQSFGVVTLGASDEVQYIDGIETKDSKTKRFLLHYNFPPFSVGEVKRMGFTSRREIGHGHLAERALTAVLPSEEEFPYVIRMVSEVLESNGSSSMATVCSGSLSMMAAGVPLKKPVAGIAMGLVWDKEKGVHKVLSDIQGLEDHDGDMDFKVTGTADGITAFQMDVKTIGITPEIMAEAMQQAKDGRIYILGKMNEVISEPRSEVASSAPKVESISIDKDAIGQVIGSGGKVIKKLQELGDCNISIDEEGLVSIYGTNRDNLKQVKEWVSVIVKGLQKDEILTGKVERIEVYGIFIEFAPGVSAMLHQSTFKKDRSGKVSDNFNIGDEVTVKCIGKDDKFRAKLIEWDEANPENSGTQEERRSSYNRDRGGRSGGYNRDRGGKGGYNRDRSHGGGDYKKREHNDSDSGHKDSE